METTCLQRNKANLQPDTMRKVVDGNPTTLWNADAVILQIAKSTNPAAQNLYLSYRAAEAVLARVEPWLDDGTRRDLALRHALKEDGVEPSATAWTTEAIT